MVMGGVEDQGKDCGAMLMGMGMGMVMGMDNADAVMQCWQEEGRMMQEPSSDKGGS
jgi:hypothetical protein